MSKSMLDRAMGVLVGVWLIIVLLAYFGLVQLTGPLADIALGTLLVIIAGMVWKYLLRPIFRGRSRAE